MVSDVRSVALNLNSKELIFLQKVTRQEYHFITDEEQEARLRLRDKLLEGFFDQNENRIVLNLTRDELLQRVWGRRASHRDRTVDVFVRKLREKIDARSSRNTFIQTRYGVGYKLDPAPK